MRWSRHVMADAPETVQSTNIASPFGGRARLVQTLDVSTLIAKYRHKCGIDVARWFSGLRAIHLYECTETGFRFWQPACIAGDEVFYHLVGSAWMQYYRTNRWEYGIARDFVKKHRDVLEIGAGRGFFLKSLEGVTNHAVGLELNGEAISTKVTKFPIEHAQLPDIVKRHPESFDVVCAFQVLEHIVDPCEFLNDAIRCLRNDGLVILSTPNLDYPPFRRQEDAFDLPPHHVGHFSELVFRNIARKLKLDVIAMRKEPRSYVPHHDNTRAGESIGRRYATTVMRGACNLLYRLRRAPGPNILVVMRKHSKPSSVLI